MALIYSANPEVGDIIYCTNSKMVEVCTNLDPLTWIIIVGI